MRVPPRTLMVVDDEPSHRRLLLDIMTPLGFKLIEASDGPDCLEKLKFNRPDAFLPDLSMPGMNGWELARIGYPSALRQRLDALKTSNRLRDGQARLLNDFVQRFDFAALIRTLEEMP
jgi:CheY-like chemotaxis protein